MRVQLYAIHLIYVLRYSLLYCCSRPTKNKVVLSQINLLWLYGHQRNSRYHRVMSCSYCNNNKEIGNSRHSTSHSLKLLHHDITMITIQTIPNRQSAFALTITQQTAVTITGNQLLSSMFTHNLTRNEWLAMIGPAEERSIIIKPAGKRSCVVV